MSTQIEIDKKLTKYLQDTGYRSDEIIDQLVAETLALGNVARMQIAPEQGQFLEIIVKISKAKNCLEIGRFTGLSSLCIAKGLPEKGKLVAIAEETKGTGIQTCVHDSRSQPATAPWVESPGGSSTLPSFLTSYE